MTSRSAQVEQLKKKNAKKGANKDKTVAAEEPPAAMAESPKEEAKASTDATETDAADNTTTQGNVDDGAKTPEVAPGAEPTTAEEPSIETTKTRARQASLSTQSKLRSSSFRQGGPLSPSMGSDAEEAASAPEIYRKQAAKIEELEKENKRLAKEAGDAEKRWKKAENELEDLREAESSRPSTAVVSSSTKEVEKLVSLP